MKLTDSHKPYPVLSFFVKNNSEEMASNVSILNSVENLFGSKIENDPIEVGSSIKGISMSDIYVSILLKPFYHIEKTLVYTNVNKLENAICICTRDTTGLFVQVPVPLIVAEGQSQKNVVERLQEYRIDKFTEIKIQKMYPGEVLNFCLFEKQND